MLKTAIVLNGCESSNFLKENLGKGYDCIIAADGGANLLYKCGIKPDLIIGDLDSINPGVMDYYEDMVRIIRFPVEKDETDGKIALDKAMEMKSDVIDIFCWNGQRLDMVTGLLLMLRSYPPIITARSRELDVGIVKGYMSWDVAMGETWSFIPAGEDAGGVELTGFKYYKDNLCITMDNPTIGISNVTNSTHVAVKIKEGSLIYFRWKEKPL